MNDETNTPDDDALSIDDVAAQLLSQRDEARKQLRETRAELQRVSCTLMEWDGKAATDAIVSQLVAAEADLADWKEQNEVAALRAELAERDLRFLNEARVTAKAIERAELAEAELVSWKEQNEGVNKILDDYQTARERELGVIRRALEKSFQDIANGNVVSGDELIADLSDMIARAIAGDKHEQ